MVEIELDANLPQRADAQDTGHHHAPPPSTPKAPEIETVSVFDEPESDEADAGTVVGAMESSNAIRAELSKWKDISERYEDRYFQMVAAQGDVAAWMVLDAQGGALFFRSKPTILAAIPLVKQQVTTP